MPPRKTIYLANPYGFSTQQRDCLLPPLVAALEGLGLEVWEPFARNAPQDLTAPGWAHEVARADARDVGAADAVFAVVNGTPPDEGVCIELGLAIAWGKPYFLFRDDFRRCADSETYPLNLMLFAGLPAQNWQDFFYKEIAEISDPQKALGRWATGEMLAELPSCPN